MWSIRQLNANQWEVLRDGTRVGELHTTYGAAVQAIAGEFAALAGVTFDDASFDQGGGDGLLPERWTAPVAWVSRATAGGRDFSGCQWSWRDPAACLLPLMLQTSTEVGHFGAELAGYIDTISGAAEGTMSGFFYENEEGIELRDMLLDGRRYGVSVDPTEDVTAVIRCDVMGEDGWCESESVVFEAYEIGGLTATPFPCFEEAFMVLEGTDTAPADDTAAPAEAPAAVAAAGTVALHRRPLASLFDMAEPVPGGDHADLLVEQPDGGMAVPLTILPAGEDGFRPVFGHLARWGQCHTAYPDQCVTAPHSASGYRWAHIGATRTTNGDMATGVLTAGTDHAAMHLAGRTAQDHYANTGMGWADARFSDGDLGVWFAGAVRRDVTDDQAAILAAGSMSGDWRAYPLDLELVAALAVNVPGFPIARRDALAASGLAGMPTAPAFARRVAGGRPMAMVASGVVSRCPECDKRSRIAAAGTPDLRSQLDRIEATLGVLDRRTRHLNADAGAALAGRIRAPRT